MEFPQVSEPTTRGEFRGNGVRGLTAAAVLLAAGALNVAAEQPADAVSGGTWDRLAGCESGGNWRIDTGNGFSGGLQLAHRTWRSFGGQAYGSRAARATRAQQIQVAERVLARQGWGAWPACSARLGINSAARPSTPRPGTAHSAPRRHVQAPTHHRLRHPHFHEKRHHEKLRHDKHAVRHRSTSGTIFVNSGDTVSGIAAAHGFRWQEFYRFNRNVIGANPNLIFPGTRLAVPRSHSGSAE
ncbi:transglycosylase family protein [Streptomyces sp. NPDC021749]|uniref:transglycosylase family protein n=1 Tax=Streptomyces sp. NPDC021749 TaxID=3154905 RepID=UPI0033E73D72